MIKLKIRTIKGKFGWCLISPRKNIVEPVFVIQSTNLKRSDKEQEVKENKPEAEDIDEDESAISVRDLRAKKTLLLETHNINETIKQRLREYNLCLERPVTEPALPGRLSQSLD